MSLVRPERHQSGLRLAVVATSFLPRIGGAQFVVYWQLLALDKHFGFLRDRYSLEAVVFILPKSYRSRALENFEHVEVEYFDEQVGFWGKLVTRRRISGILRRRDITVVHGHDVVSGGLVIPGLSRKWLKVLTSHGSDLAVLPEHRFGARLSLTGRIAVRIGLLGTGLLIPVSQVMAGFASQVFPEEKTVVVPNFLGESKSTELFTPRSIVDALGIKKDHLVVLTLGGPRPLKGHKNLVRAFADFLDLAPHARLLIGSEEDLFVELKKLIVDLGIQDQCVFIGEVLGGAKAELLSRADIYANTSFFEAFGLASLEAVFAGTAFLGPNHSGPAEIFTHKKDAFLSDPGSVADILQGLVFLSDAKNRANLSARASQLLPRYSERVVINQLFSAYRKFEKPGRNRRPRPHTHRLGDFLAERGSGGYASRTN